MRLRRDVWFHCLLVLNAVVVLDSVTLGERQLFPHTRIPNDALSTRRAIVRRKIVLYHNFFRTKVRPQSSNMLLMSWHPEAARLAQRYAEKCIFLQHNDAKENAVPHLGNCGQNLFVSLHKSPWFFAIKSWFLEYKNFTYGVPIRDIHSVGHYTQMVWSTSHKVGCGIAHCAGGPWGSFYNYVCHYCPTGNFDTITQYPYKVGSPCADCPGHCVGGKLCTNWCPEKDFFSNCDDLVKYPDTCRQGVCNATCMCTGKIHKNYPW
ncbi:cysteine-rich venom protein LIO1-like [Plodia interpunctella]|uniref:cysteine-rich venom protein LIO1-like n=1 Tax=Plodia interpunctella TaxID=58824 RepID=UPI002367A370|nr:cysteine-rich venom protein LIO1-like [Plodia interpunctella]XP_053605281.1 cysteine-rich venom protein LIO1-like [Plodia interpunctella]